MLRNFAPPGSHAVLQHAWVRVGGRPPVDPTGIAFMTGREDELGLDVYYWTVEDDQAPAAPD